PALPGINPAGAAIGTDQEGRDQEDRGVSVEQGRSKLDTHVYFETEWHEYDNLDLRALDETSDQSILDSDDRGGFAFTGVSLDLGYQVDPSTRFVMSTSYRGLWGNDQFGNINRFGGLFYFNAMYVEWKPRGKYAPTFRVGRMRFDIGGLGGAREFVLGDVLDQIRVDFPLGDVGTLVTIPVNVVGLSAENSDVNFVRYAGQQQTSVFGFRGDRMTRRHGAILVIHPKRLPQLDSRTYAFFTHVGALGSGADISYQGRLGNFSDRDWLFNAGTRLSWTFADMLTPFAEFNLSTGIDRKETVTSDVGALGFAWGAGVSFNKPKPSRKGVGGHADLQYFESSGPTWDTNGVQYSHGYVGMKARQVGGLVANRFMGWHPTAYLGSFGVEDTPNDIDRKSATRVISVDGLVELPGPVSVGAGVWYMQDKGYTYLDQGDVDTITPPYGYSREELRAQARVGRLLGVEVDGTLGVELTRHLDLVVQGGALLPGPYYQIPVARVVGTALGSASPEVAWDFSGGVRVGF
ncbi:MAG TPA: hypothetical protein PKA64_07150, partial [Myxococcota bacterium]|nr:hypothetical protein [Myxococcota bacterium]